MRKAHILVLVFVLALLQLRAQLVSVDAILDTSKLRIGEQANIDVYLSYKAGKNLRVQWPSIGDTLTEKVEVVSVSPVDTTLPQKSNSDKYLQHQRITVSVYDSGYYAIPGFKFIVNDDTAHPLFTKPLFLEVHTVPTDSSAAKTKDIKPPLEEPFNWRWYTGYLYAGLGILAVLITTVLITRYYAKRRKITEQEPAKPKLPAHIIALAALERIKAESVWKDGKIKEYYSAISDTIRFYMEERFGLNALESTTDEIMLAFRSQVVDAESKQKLQQLLSLSDLVKFAKQFPIEAEHLFTLQNAFDFVNGTKREEEFDAAALEQLQTDTLPYERSAAANAQAVNTAGQVKKTEAKPAQSTFTPKEPRHFWIYPILALLLIALAVFITAKLIARATPVLVPSNTAAAVQGEDPIRSSATALNNQCPVMLDAQTRMDRAEALQGNILATYFTLMNVQAGQFDVEAFKEQMRPALLQQVRFNDEFRQLREATGALECNYADANGTKICVITITPADYLN